MKMNMKMFSLFGLPQFSHVSRRLLMQIRIRGAVCTSLCSALQKYTNASAGTSGSGAAWSGGRDNIKKQHFALLILFSFQYILFNAICTNSAICLKNLRFGSIEHQQLIFSGWLILHCCFLTLSVPTLLLLFHIKRLGKREHSNCQAVLLMEMEE